MPSFDYPAPKQIETAKTRAVNGLPDFDYPALTVRNTFFDAALVPGSLVDFLYERHTQSCPASGLGAPPGLEHLASIASDDAFQVFNSWCSDEDMCFPTPSVAPPVAVLMSAAHPLPQLPGTSFFGHIPPPPAAPPALPAVAGSWEAVSRLPPSLPPQGQPGSLRAEMAQAPVLRIAEALEPVLGSAELPSKGSVGHRYGTCKPCAFLYTKGCESGSDCAFCHLCPPGEKKRRNKTKTVAAKLSASGLDPNLAVEAASWYTNSCAMVMPAHAN